MKTYTFGGRLSPSGEQKVRDVAQKLGLTPRFGETPATTVTVDANDWQVAFFENDLKRAGFANSDFTVASDPETVK